MKKSRKPYYLFAVISLVTFVVFLPALKNDFVSWDDNVYVYDNYHVRSLDRAFFRWAFTDTSIVYWHPVTWISHAIDVAVWGLNPAGHHLTSILLHAINTFLVMCLVMMLLAAAKDGPGLDRPEDVSRRKRFLLIAAGVTGALFGIHPLRVESVVWISERKDLLAALFFLLSVYAYVAAKLSAREESAPGTKRRFRAAFRSVVPLGCYLLAVASKPMAITLPFVLLLLDWHPLGRVRSRGDILQLIKEKAPFFAIGILVALITFVAQRDIGATPSLGLVSIQTRILVAASGLTGYLGKMVLPVGLEPLYLHPRNIAVVSTAHVMTLAFLACVTALCALLAKREKIWLVLWTYYIITLLPVIGLLQAGSQAMADRFTYLPSIAPSVLAGIGVALGWSKLESRGRTGPAALAVAVAAALCVAGALAIGTIRQTGVWKDSVVFWSRVVAREPSRFPAAYANRAIAYYERNEREQALRDIDRAIALEPGFAEAYASRGWMLRNEGLTDRALADLTTAVRLKPTLASAYMSRGVMLGEAGDYGGSIDDLTRAIALKPDMYEAYTARGAAFLRSGLPSRAVQDLNVSIGLYPANADAYLNRGAAFEDMGLLDRALGDYDRALQIDPRDHAGYNARGGVAGKLGRIPDAIADQTKAIELKPDFAKAYFDRGSCYRSTGNAALARKDFRKACELGEKAGCDAP